MRTIVWVVEAVLGDLRSFPDKARQIVGYALSEAQFGRTSTYAKPFKGYTSDGIFEIVVEDRGDAYRALYATKIGDDIYVLHCFNKKSPRRSETPRPAKSTLDRRLKRAKEIARTRMDEAKKREGDV